MQHTGMIRKMRTAIGADNIAQYELPIGDQSIALNAWIGQPIRLEWTGNVECIACQRPIKKTYQQGYCFPCTQRLAQCDMCIVKPELCHYDQGTCREPNWGEQHCLKPHYVYLANSSALKVGITRYQNVPHRWIDQGAIQALPIFAVSSRRLSGLIEVILKQWLADKTNWRAMLKGSPMWLNLVEIKHDLLLQSSEKIAELVNQYGHDAIQTLNEASITIEYPVQQYPEKVKPLNITKTPKIEGILQGIKGQYWLLDSGVLNIRKFAGYECRLHLGAE